MAMIPPLKRCTSEGVLLSEDSTTQNYLTEITAGTWIEFTNKISDPEWAEKDFIVPVWKAYMVMLHCVEESLPSLLVEINRVNDSRLEYVALGSDPEDPVVLIYWKGSVYSTLKGMSTQDFFVLQESFRERVPWEWLKKAYDAVDKMLTPVSAETKAALKKD